MTGFSALEPGNNYKFLRIIDGVYTVLEGFEDVADGGMYWTVFRPELRS